MKITLAVKAQKLAEKAYDLARKDFNSSTTIIPVFIPTPFPVRNAPPSSWAPGIPVLPQDTAEGVFRVGVAVIAVAGLQVGAAVIAAAARRAGAAEAATAEDSAAEGIPAAVREVVKIATDIWNKTVVK
jgi:hypothetical protein